MLNAYLDTNNTQHALDIFTKAIEMGINFKLRPNVFNHHSFSELYALVQESIPQTSTELSSLLDEVQQKILDHSTNFASPYAMAFPDAGNSIAAITGAILSDFINQNLINWVPCAPIGTIIEMVVINWMRELVGFPIIEKPTVPEQVGGIVTSGGVASNTIALLLAREHAFPNTMKNGVGAIQTSYAAIVPDGIEHYSSRLSMGWLGLGENQIIKAKTKNFIYDLPALEDLLQQCKKQEINIISLTAYAGDSRSMSCDHFTALRNLCDQHRIWLHIDGCHGTQLLFSDEQKIKLAGIELADSVTFDPHKVLNIPYALSLLLVKNHQVLKCIQRPEDIITGEEHSFGQITPLFGSRPFNSLKLYLLIKQLGKKELGAMIDRRCKMAELLAMKIKACNDFILINPKIGINSVIFMYCPPTLLTFIKKNKDHVKWINLLNGDIHKLLVASGAMWLHHFNIPDLSNILGHGEKIMLRPLRFMSGNPILLENHLDEMLAEIRKLGQSMQDHLQFAENY